MTRGWFGISIFMLSIATYALALYIGAILQFFYALALRIEALFKSFKKYIPGPGRSTGSKKNSVADVSTDFTEPTTAIQRPTSSNKIQHSSTDQKNERPRQGSATASEEKTGMGIVENTIEDLRLSLSRDPSNPRLLEEGHSTGLTNPLSGQHPTVS
jgi:hypothetical protein